MLFVLALILALITLTFSFTSANLVSVALALVTLQYLKEPLTKFMKRNRVTESPLLNMKYTLYKYTGLAPFEFCDGVPQIRKLRNTFPSIYGIKISNSISISKDVFYPIIDQQRLKNDRFLRKIFAHQQNLYAVDSYEDIQYFNSFYDEELDIQLNILSNLISIRRRYDSKLLFTYGFEEIDSFFYFKNHKWTREEISNYTGPIFTITNYFYEGICLGLTEKDKNQIRSFYDGDINKCIIGYLASTKKLTNDTLNRLLGKGGPRFDRDTLDIISFIHKEHNSWNIRQPSLANDLELDNKLDIQLPIAIAKKLDNNMDMRRLQSSIDKKISSHKKSTNLMLSNIKSELEDKYSLANELNNAKMEELAVEVLGIAEDMRSYGENVIDAMKGEEKKLSDQLTQIEEIRSESLSNMKTIKSFKSEIDLIKLTIERVYGKPIPRMSKEDLEHFRSIAFEVEDPDNYLDSLLTNVINTIDSRWAKKFTELENKLNSLIDVLKPKAETQIIKKAETNVAKMTFEEERIMKSKHIKYNKKFMDMGELTKKSCVYCFYNRRNFMTTLASKLNMERLKSTNTSPVMYEEAIKFCDMLIKMGVTNDLSKGLFIDFYNQDDTIFTLNFVI